MADDLDLTLPFTTAQARAAGITAGQLRSLRFRRLHHSIHVAAGVPLSSATRARGALLLFPEGAHIGFALAAELYGVAVPRGLPIAVVVPVESHRRRHGALRCVVRRSPSRLLRGVPVATPEALFEQLAEVLGFVDLVVAGDALLHGELTTVARLRQCLEQSARPGAKRALRTLPWLRVGAESPPETRLRLLLQLAGLPAFETQVKIHAPGGRLLQRHDLGHRRAKVAVEYNGRHHVEIIEQWERDIERHEVSDDLDWRTITVVSAGLNRDPARTIERVARALRKRGVHVGPISDEWKRYFNPSSHAPAPGQNAGFDDPNPTF